VAITSSAVWEIRTTGSDTNGGVFDVGVAGYGTDYSQQAAAQLSVTDGVTTTSSATVTSATGGFTAAMIGNGINIAGTIYVITAVASTNSITVDHAVAAGASALAMKVGGCIASPGMCGSFIVSGNTIWIKTGTYFITSATNNVSGGPLYQTAYQYNNVQGYNLVRGDAPSINSGNQPVISLSSSPLTNQPVFCPGNLSTTRYVTINSSVASSYTGNMFNLAQYIDCNAVCASGSTGFSQSTAINCQASGGNFGFNGCTSSGCYVTGCANGFYGGTATDCIAQSCQYAGFNQNALVQNCTAYSCGNGYQTVSTMLAIACYAEGNTGYGFKGGSAADQYACVLISCAGYNNTSGNTIYCGINNGFLNLLSSGVVNAPGGNFTPKSSGPLKAAGFPQTWPTIPTTSYPDIGAAQHMDSGGGGGGTVTGGGVNMSEMGVS
jgi:hypothetical protein